MQGGWTNTDNDWQLKRLQLDSVRMVEKIVDLIRENVERDVITHGQEYERLFGKSSAQFSELLTMVVEKLEQEGVTPPALISWLKEAAMQDSLPAASDLRDSQSATLSFLERVIPDGERLQLSQEFSPAEPSHEEPTIPVTRSDAQTASSTQLNALGQLSPPRSLNSALGAGQSQRLSGPHNAVNGQSSSGPHSVVSAWDYQDESEEAQPTSSAPSFASMPAPAAAEPATMPSTNPLTPESGAAPASAFSAPLPPVQNPLPQPQQAYQAAPVINGSQWENLQSAPLPQSFASSPIAPPAVPVAQSVAPPVAPQPVAPQPVAPQPVAPQPVAPQAVAEQAPLPVRPSSSHFQLPPLPPLPAASSLPLPQYTPPAAPVAPALPVEPVKTLVQPADQVESPWAAPPFPIPSPVFTPNLQTPPVPYTPSAYAPALF